MTARSRAPTNTLQNEGIIAANYARSTDTRHQSGVADLATRTGRLQRDTVARRHPAEMDDVTGTHTDHAQSRRADTAMARVHTQADHEEAQDAAHVHRLDPRHARNRGNATRKTRNTNDTRSQREDRQHHRKQALHHRTTRTMKTRTSESTTRKRSTRRRRKRRRKRMTRSS